MQAVIIITVLGLCLGLNSAEVPSPNFLPATDLAEFMMQSRDTNNPLRSMECFNHYQPIMREVEEEYKESHSNCLETSKLARSGVHEASIAKREEIADEANLACGQFSVCNEHDDSAKFFECYKTQANINSRSMYAISNNAGDASNKLNEDYMLIDNNEYKCTNESERVYIRKTSDVNLEMRDCLTGKNPVPTAPPAATEAPIETPTENPEVVNPSTEADNFDVKIDDTAAVHKQHRAAKVHFANKVRKHLRRN